MKNYKEKRPWGSFEHLLDEEYCKVKRIIVKPGQRLSYQYHKNRNEWWVIVQGEALVTLDDEEYLFHKGMVVEIPVKTKHRVENKFDKDLEKLIDSLDKKKKSINPFPLFGLIIKNYAFQIK